MRLHRLQVGRFSIDKQQCTFNYQIILLYRKVIKSNIFVTQENLRTQARQVKQWSKIEQEKIKNKLNRTNYTCKQYAVLFWGPDIFSLVRNQ